MVETTSRPPDALPETGLLASDEDVRPSSRSRLRAVAFPLLSFTLVCLFWQYGPGLFGISSLILPPLSDVLTELVNGMVDGTMAYHLGVTIYEALVGFLLGSLLGLVSGSLIALYSVLDTALKPYILALHATPKIALAPLFVIMFGVGSESKIAVATLVAWMPVMINVMVGLKDVDPDRTELVRALGGSRWQVLRTVRIPSALGHLFAGLQAAALLGLLGAVAAEFVGSSAGVGFFMANRMAVLDTASVFAAIIVLSASGLLLFGLMHLIHKRVVFWTN